MARLVLPGRSLRGRLMASYVVVVAVTLISVVSALSVLLPAYRGRQVEARLTELARPTLRLVMELVLRGASLDDIRAELNEQADATGLRILVIGRTGTVISDSQVNGSLQGRPFVVASPPGPPRPAPVQRGQFVDGGDTYRYVAMPVTAPARARGDVAQLVLAQSEAAWGDVWGELGWRLALAGSIAAVVATIMATLMARSLYQPIVRLKAAAEGMARGHYDQQVPEEGPAELAGLARAFNDMAGEVRASRQSMQEFVANVSHELRTPLTSVRGFVEALSDGTVSDEAGRRRSLAVIGAELRRLQRLVTGLLDLSRFESGQVALRRESVDLAAVVAQCGEIVSARAEEAGVTLIVEVPSPSPFVTGDADRLEQVIANLLDNALRYTPTGGRVGLRLMSDSGQARVAVADTGPGVPAAAVPHLFERFFTADPARAGHGAGLGLAIAREIALAHGGDIEVASRVGEGSTFTLVLPLASAASVAARGRQAATVR
ncbi:MAG: HAMP domain-containing histidine kinase [Chloroflexi bacterium]|nr:HAMP domain-containing histidine kinase [Chloroflexota bacterium]